MQFITTIECVSDSGVEILEYRDTDTDIDTDTCTGADTGTGTGTAAGVGWINPRAGETEGVGAVAGAVAGAGASPGTGSRAIFLAINSC